MRLLMTAWSFYPAQEGGPSNALYWLATGLARSGYIMRVVTTDRCLPKGSVPINEWYSLNGFDVIYQSAQQSESLLLDELDKCDVLLTDGICKLRYFRLVINALKKNKKVILSPRGELFDSAINHKGQLFGILKKTFILYMRVAFRNRVIFHATSEEEKNTVFRYMGKRAHVVLIPNYMILPDKIDVDNSTTPEPYLLYVGRLNQIKNIDIILSGLAQSSAFMNGKVKFKLAGEKTGEYYELLVRQAKELGIADKVEFLGLVTGAEKDRLYAGAKCLLLMSKSENFGNVIVEALSQGTPVIASKGTPWQQLDTKGAGWWIDAVPDKIAYAVDNLLALDDEENRALRHNAYALSREFEIFTNVGKWEMILGK